jgi:carboxylesterase type B
MIWRKGLQNTNQIRNLKGKANQIGLKKDCLILEIFYSRAMECDGHPIIYYVVYGYVLTHGSLYGLTIMKTNLLIIEYIKREKD